MAVLHPDGPGGLGLAFFDGAHAAAHDFGDERGRIEGKREHARPEFIEPDPDDRQREEDEENLDEERRASDKVHIGRNDPPQKRALRQRGQTENGPEKEPDDGRQRRHLKRNDRALKKKGRGLSDDRPVDGHRNLCAVIWVMVLSPVTRRDSRQAHGAACLGWPEPLRAHGTAWMRGALS